ncbi:MAG: DUF3450 domain-containing protein [Candidatus Saccharimonas sp.]|nr:MAG: DUF3450 domain-containing protein [Candidatus Saccharimonas sp.]
MTKNNISLSDIKDISKSLYSECIEHGHKIKYPFGEFQLHPITDLTIAIYSRGEFTKNVGEIDPFSFVGKNFQPISEGVNMCCNTLEIERVIFKGIAILLENGAVLILNKQDRTVQQIISVNEISEILNNRYSMMDKSFDLDPCTSERYYNQMLGYKFIDISNEAPEILEQLEKWLKERQQILDKIEELEEWLNNFNQKVEDSKDITSQELNECDSKKSELDSLKNKLENINFRLT